MAVDPLQNDAGDASQVDPSLAQEAQIPFQSFAIPDFPPQASNLKALTLTSDIKVDEYSTHLQSNVPPVPRLPPSIHSLTLELFALGYPPGFLRALVDRLPNLKSLVVYSQLFSGTTAESHLDALAFFEKCAQNGLTALHLLDVFGTTAFFVGVGSIFNKHSTALRFLEVNYNYRYDDEDFLTRLPGLGLLSLVRPSLVTCAFNISLADVTNDPQDPANLHEKGNEVETAGQKKRGMVPLDEEYGKELVRTLTEQSAPEDLKLLNTTLYTVSAEELSQILQKHPGITILSAALRMRATSEYKQTVLKAIAHCASIEQVELVMFPDKDLMEEASAIHMKCLLQLSANICRSRDTTPKL
ncbi:MAG: hypothetical protein M1837_004773 [Sclerophora amabilis]|nr:MAG: hypothetical protein M1837_004773 [Sclerophora amabilis]